MSKEFPKARWLLRRPRQRRPRAPLRARPTLHFKGELYGEEDLEFQGQLEGRSNTPAA